MRHISDKFFQELMYGKFADITQYVRNDHTLDMELRGKSIIVYYRGAKLFEVFDEGTIECNKAYWETVSKGVNKPYNCATTFKEKPSLEYLLCKMEIYKTYIDFYLADVRVNSKQETRQMIVRENNYSAISNSTDYYILDTRHVFSAEDVDAVIDMVALEWKSTTVARKNNANLKMAFAMLKFGNESHGGDDELVHNIENFVKISRHHGMLMTIARDMEKVFEQKVRLGLIPSFKERIHWQDDCEISIYNEKPEMLIMLANRDPENKTVIEQIGKALIKYSNTKDWKYLERIYVVKASEAGYGLYKYGADRESVRFQTLKEYYMEVMEDIGIKK